MRWTALAFAIIMLATLSLPADAPAGAKVILPDGQSLEVFFAFQFWNITTLDATSSQGRDLDARSDFSIRRGRFGIKGKLQESVKYRIWFAYDNVGKDPLSAATGSAQSSANRDFYLWDALCTVQIDPTWLNLTLGYFRPQVGRESITSAFAVDSFTKTLPNSYPRAHIVGRSSGRETGLNVGGLYQPGRWGLNYNFGLFDTNHESITGSSLREAYWSPLWTGRLALTLGDAEMERYDLGYRINTFGRRKGVTLALNGTHQGRTNETAQGNLVPPGTIVFSYGGGFAENALLGADLLLNYGQLNLNAEYDLLYRRFDTDVLLLVAGLDGREYTDRVWHVRAGYNLTLRNGQVIEPVAMISRYRADPFSAVYAGGRHEMASLGVNWYLDGNDWKINLHYAWQELDLRPQGGAAPREIGDFLGLGFQLVF
jgi:hypothetical protein